MTYYMLSGTLNITKLKLTGHRTTHKRYLKTTLPVHPYSWISNTSHKDCCTKKTFNFGCGRVDTLATSCNWINISAQRHQLKELFIQVSFHIINWCPTASIIIVNILWDCSDIWVKWSGLFPSGSAADRLHPYGDGVGAAAYVSPPRGLHRRPVLSSCRFGRNAPGVRQSYGSAASCVN